MSPNNTRPAGVDAAITEFHKVFHGIHQTPWETLKAYITELEARPTRSMDAEVVVLPSDEETAANLIAEVDGSASPNNIDWVAQRLAHHRHARAQPVQSGNADVALSELENALKANGAYEDDSVYHYFEALRKTLKNKKVI